MPAKSPPPTAPESPPLVQASLLPRLFAVLFGSFLGLALLKFGNPPIMEKYTTTPEDIYQVIFASPWPIGWAYILLGGLVIAGLLAVRWRRAAPLWITG